ncbi:uncharacterized protein LOC144146497 [Haemaphysalis longicornis]
MLRETEHALPSRTLQRLRVTPLPRNVNPNYNPERRAARARTLTDTYASDTGALFVDAARYAGSRDKFVAVAVKATTGEIYSACSVRVRSAQQAEEAAIALALTDQRCSTVLSDSRSAIRSYARNRDQPPSTKARLPCTYESRGHKLATLFVMTAGSAHATQFPTMLIVYGGVPFLLAYLVFLGGVAYPMMRLESNLAQFAGDGNRGIFSTVPLFIGVGYSMTVYMVTHVVADSVPLSDSLTLLFLWRRTIYWPHECPGAWMTKNSSCYAISHGSTPCKPVRDWLSKSSQRAAVSEGLPVAAGDRVTLVVASAYYQVARGCIPDLQDSAPPYDFRGEYAWVPHSYGLLWTTPVFAVAAVWLTVFAVANNGFLRLKKFFYGLVLVHLVSTLLLLTKASTLSGALRGFRMLVHANWTSVGNWQMWSRALYVSLDSVGVASTVYLGVERFNSFKNKFQEDAMFVLAADTATKGIGTVTAFLCLGHLSYRTGLDIRMLLNADSNFVVSVTPQALSLAPYAEFWSRVYSLWLASMILPKFLIVPEIIIEVLAASHPMLLVHRRAAHFIICWLLCLLSFISCFPGGAKAISVIAAHENTVRLLLLGVESLTILQLYGIRRLVIDSTLMTDEKPGLYVRLCWTLIIPVTLIGAFWAKLAQGKLHEGRYPLWLRLFITWLEAIELSFIPVFAMVLLFRTKLNVRDSLIPLPTWEPLNWEMAMKYKQALAAEGLDQQQQQAKIRKKLMAHVAAQPPVPHKLHSASNNSSDMLGNHLILTTDAKISPMTSDWRYDSSEDNPVKFRSPPNEVVTDSGTLALSRHPSSLMRSVMAKANRAVVSSAASPVPKPPVEPSATVAFAAPERQKQDAAATVPPLATSKERLSVDNSSCIAGNLVSPSPITGKVTDAGPSYAAGNTEVVLPVIECEALVRDMSDLLKNIVGPLKSNIERHPSPAQSLETILKPSLPTPVKLPSASLVPSPIPAYLQEEFSFDDNGIEKNKKITPGAEPHDHPGQSGASMALLAPSPQCEDPKLAVAMNSSSEARERQPGRVQSAQMVTMPPLHWMPQVDGSIDSLPPDYAVELKSPPPKAYADAKKTVLGVPQSPGWQALTSTSGENSPAVVGTPPGNKTASPITWSEASHPEIPVRQDKGVGATEAAPAIRSPRSAPASPAPKAKHDRKIKSVVGSPVHPKGMARKVPSKKAASAKPTPGQDFLSPEQSVLSPSLSWEDTDNLPSPGPAFGAQSPQNKKSKTPVRRRSSKRRRAPEQAKGVASPRHSTLWPLSNGTDNLRVKSDVPPLFSHSPQVLESLEQPHHRPSERGAYFQDLAGTPDAHSGAAQQAAVRNASAPQSPAVNEISPSSRHEAPATGQPTVGYHSSTEPGEDDDVPDVTIDSISWGRH